VIEDVKFRLMERIEKALLREGNKIGYKRTSEQTRDMRENQSLCTVLMADGCMSTIEGFGAKQV
jgi:hypothetical protein